jgi:DNA repair protein RecO (recombination protein O)
MQEFVTVTGIIIKSESIGDYDRRVVILTKERGKIAAFAKGSRKPTSRLLAATNPFSYGEFKLYEGRTSYNLMEVNIQNYFEALRQDFEGAYYGMYFLELMDYYTRENNDEVEFLKLLYQSLRAISKSNLKNQLIRAIFELKSLAISGEFPGIPSDIKLQESTVYTIEYIVYTNMEKLYTFDVSDQVLQELKMVAKKFQKKFTDRKFNSLEIIDQL